MASQSFTCSRSFADSDVRQSPYFGHFANDSAGHMYSSFTQTAQLVRDGFFKSYRKEGAATFKSNYPGFGLQVGNDQQHDAGTMIGAFLIVPSSRNVVDAKLNFGEDRMRVELMTEKTDDDDMVGLSFLLCNFTAEKMLFTLKCTDGWELFKMVVPGFHCQKMGGDTKNYRVLVCDGGIRRENCQSLYRKGFDSAGFEMAIVIPQDGLKSTYSLHSAPIYAGDKYRMCSDDYSTPTPHSIWSTTEICEVQTDGPGVFRRQLLGETPSDQKAMGVLLGGTPSDQKTMGVPVHGAQRAIGDHFRSTDFKRGRSIGVILEFDFLPVVQTKIPFRQLFNPNCFNASIVNTCSRKPLTS